MGAGWIRGSKPISGDRFFPADMDTALSAATASALSGAFGVWISAASSVPPIVILGASGFAIVLLAGRQSVGSGRVLFAPAVWHRWGNVGAVATLFFFLLEYAPNHLTSVRLEANNPLYSLAWWAGSRCVALFGKHWLEGTWPSFIGIRSLVLLGFAALLPAFIALLGRDRVFVVMDPFLSDLHNTYIQEFLPIWKTINIIGRSALVSLVLIDSLPLLIAGVSLAFLRSRTPIWLWFGVLAGLGFSALAILQSRWGLNAAAFHCALGLALFCSICAGRPAWARLVACLLVVSGLFGYTLYSRLSGGLDDLAARRVSPRDALSLLYRDIAASLRLSQPQGEIILLSSPNGSTGIGYYGRFSTLGTLYWENVDGLKAAARIFSARSDEEAAALIRERRVTHVAIVSNENFIAEYFALLNPAPSRSGAGHYFGHRLLVDRTVPVWLRVIPYRIPENLVGLKVSVMLFQVAFGQSTADALYHIGLSKLFSGQIAEAERDFDMLIKASPESFQPYFRKAEILRSRGAWELAADYALSGAMRAPPAARRDLVAEAAAMTYRAGRPEVAARMYRSYLSSTFDAEIAANLAFILASTSTPGLRDLPAAESLLRQASEAAPASTGVLSARAVVLAAAGDYNGAARLQERLVIAFRKAGAVAELATAEQRLKAFLAHQPWRE